MTNEERKNHKYIGDAVYAEYEDGDIVLRTNDHRDYYCDNRIYLDKPVWGELIKFIEEITQ